MISRRQLLSSAVSLALVGRWSLAQSAPFELVIRQGRVIDPSMRLDGIRDIGIAAGRIALIAPEIANDANETLDARGKIVTPGLIDIHTHAGRDADGPALALRDGVTGIVDAGSAGADNFEAVAANIRAAPQLGRALINIARTGIVAGGELHNLSAADVGVARGVIARNLDIVAGVKVRLSENVAGENDLEVLRRALEAAGAFDLPVMAHIGQSVSPMRAILPLLRSGDVVTHVYAPAPNGILDDRGRLFPEVTAARRRGVIFDFGNGVNGHFSWDMITRSTQQGFWPDTLSTDWNAMSRTTGVVDFPNVLSKFLLAGMPLADIVACATTHPARVFAAFSDRGTLNVGAPADLAIMELRDGSFDFLDNYEGVQTGTQRLFPSRTVLGGALVSAGT